MKRLFYVFLTVVLCIGMTGCSSSDEKSQYVQMLAIESFIRADEYLMVSSGNSISPQSEYISQMTANTYYREKVREYINSLFSSAENEDVKRCLSNLNKVLEYEEKIYGIIKNSPQLALLDIGNLDEPAYDSKNGAVANAKREADQYRNDIKGYMEKYYEISGNVRDESGYSDGEQVSVDGNMVNQYLNTCSYVLKDELDAQKYFLSMNIGEAQLEFLKEQSAIIKDAMTSLQSFEKDYSTDSGEYRAAHAIYTGLEDIHVKYSKGVKELSSRSDKTDVVQLGDIETKARKCYSLFKSIMSGNETDSESESTQQETSSESEQTSETQSSDTEDIEGETVAPGDVDIENLHANATSVLPKEPGFTYIGRNARDGDMNTCWAEGVEGDGIGEYVEYVYSTAGDEDLKVSGVKVINGCCNSQEAYYNNNRIKDAVIMVENREIKIKLDDTYGKEQVIKFKKPVKTRYIALKIASVYPGDKYQDTCLAEFMPY